MTTASITHRPIPMATAGAAVVAVLAIGAVVAMHDDTSTTAPGGATTSHVTYPNVPWHPTTAGGQTLIDP
jgi:hypothetical protein